MNRLTEMATVHEGVIQENTMLGSWTEVGPWNMLENVTLGDYSYTGPWCILQNAQVERFANIAAAVRVGPTMHPMDRPTLHHFTYRRVLYGFADTDDDEFFDWRRGQVARIGNDTWIGHGAIIMPGVTVGDGSVIGAGAVVTHDVAPYTVAAGVPARPLRLRFPEPVARALARIAWWTWDHETLHARLDDFSLPVERFVSLYDRPGAAR
jgi:phosphonate metabolism protein (transferase hexapeptide repeat family)